MQTGTLVLIIVAVIVALGVVLFQYYYKVKKRGKLTVILSLLRFVTLLSAFLLLINPQFTKNSYELEKANLVLLVDNSSSIETSDGQASIETILNEIKGNIGISEVFHLQQYSFGARLNDTDTLSFTEKNTNITKGMEAIDEIYAHTNTVVVLLTDGNQTLGEDYEFYNGNQEFPIYPIAIGDTTRYEDVRIDQLNLNKYAFLNNKYPIEIYVSYEGSGTARTSVNIAIDGKRVFNEIVTLSGSSNTKTISTLLDADVVGLKTLQVQVAPIRNERNKANNQKTIAIEVIDEKTKIAIITDVLHPDIGALTKAIQSNEQRSVSIKRPNTSSSDLEDVDIFILYQPNTTFGTVYEYIKQKKANTFTITGPKTDWRFLNKAQNSFEKNSYEQTEEITPILNAGFTIFNTADFSVQEFPPLEGNLGETIISKSHEVVLGQRVKGVALNEPLLAVIGNDLEREAILLGENVWKWRVQTYRNDRSFKNFDDFIGKIMLYLSTNKSKERLAIDYESVYRGTNEAKITATYFDKAFVFDANATLTLKLKGKENGISREIPMLLKGGYYEADLSDLSAGSYNFTTMVTGENLTKSGNFTILDFDVEQQFLSSDYNKLGRLAERTDGKLYFPSQTNSFIADLLAEKRFVPTQKSKQNVVSLIDFRFLLGIIVAALAAEWFIRKYNGLI
ncbi:MAG: vWA domain-containing protein [Saonia sp.]